MRSYINLAVVALAASSLCPVFSAPTVRSSFGIWKPDEVLPRSVLSSSTPPTVPRLRRVGRLAGLRSQAPVSTSQGPWTVLRPDGNPDPGWTPGSQPPIQRPQLSQASGPRPGSTTSVQGPPGSGKAPPPPALASKPKSTLRLNPNAPPFSPKMKLNPNKPLNANAPEFIPRPATKRVLESKTPPVHRDLVDRGEELSPGKFVTRAYGTSVASAGIPEDVSQETVPADPTLSSALGKRHVAPGGKVVAYLLSRMLNELD